MQNLNSLDNLIQVYKFGHTWPESTSKIKKEIEAIEAKNLETSKTIDLKNDEDANKILVIEEYYK